MVKLLLVCMLALFGAYVEGLGPCNCDLDNILKRHKVVPLSEIAEKDLHVQCVTADDLNPDYDEVDIYFGPVIDNEATVEIIERKRHEVIGTIKDFTICQQDPTAASTFRNYPVKGNNTTTVTVECVKDSGVFVTHTCGYGDDIPNIFISTLKNEPMTRAIYPKCQEIADALASCRVELFCLNGGRCGSGGH